MTTERKKPKANSRDKGASYERDIARELEVMTGVRFSRNLEQVRSPEHGDLLPDDALWPFSMELKRHANGVNCLTAWKVQSVAAAMRANKIPAVIFRFDRQETRVAVPLTAMLDIELALEGTIGTEWVELTLPGFVTLAREIMAHLVVRAK